MTVNRSIKLGARVLVASPIVGLALYAPSAGAVARGNTARVSSSSTGSKYCVAQFKVHSHDIYGSGNGFAVWNQAMGQAC
jgi:hypothetical protein